MTDPRACPICGHTGTPERDDHYQCLAGHRWPIEGTTMTDTEKRLAIAMLIQRAGDAELGAIHDLLMARAAMKHGFDALVRVLKFGATKHNGGQFGIAGWVTVPDCLSHAGGHVSDALVVGQRDTETRELHSAHGAARCVMATQLVDGVERGEVW